MAIEIVDFPINSMGIFHSYVNVYQRVYLHDWSSYPTFLQDIPHFHPHWMFPIAPKKTTSLWSRQGDVSMRSLAASVSKKFWA